MAESSVEKCPLPSKDNEIAFHKKKWKICSPQLMFSSVKDELIFGPRDLRTSGDLSAPADRDDWRSMNDVLRDRPIPHLLRHPTVSEDIDAGISLYHLRLEFPISKQVILNVKGTSPPEPPVEIDTSKLDYLQQRPPTPTVTICSKEETFSSDFYRIFVYGRNPVVVVKDLTSNIDFDFEQFSTSKINAKNRTLRVEIRKQIRQPFGENWDMESREKVWYFHSNRNYTTIKELKRLLAPFANQNAITHEMNNGREIWFGTNIDLSDLTNFKQQMKEVAKLPWIFKVSSKGNMLNEIGYEVKGINTVQLFMKAPGARTPGHQGNNNLCTLNINTGPGDLAWFAIAEKYWGNISELCNKRGINYSAGTWWPIKEDLVRLKIPFYEFIQKPGDVVWINCGTITWMEALGLSNSISWNLAPVTAFQYQQAIERYEWNIWTRTLSLVPMINLTWNMAKVAKISDRKLYQMMKYCLLRSLWECKKVLKEIDAPKNKPLSWRKKENTEPAHHCRNCFVEVFNILFVCHLKNRCDELVVFCYACALSHPLGFKSVAVVQQYEMKDLCKIYDRFRLAPVPVSETDMEGPGVVSV